MLKPVEWDPKRPLKTSDHVSTFAHMGAVYVYHDLYGYILKMSPDILSFLFKNAWILLYPSTLLKCLLPK